MARILVTTDYLRPGDEVDALLRKHGHHVTYKPSSGPRHRADALALFDDIDGAIVASEPITAEMLSHAATLKVIARSGVGYDSIDVAAATARGIRVCNTPGVNHDAVAELTIALMLMAARRLTSRHRRGPGGAVATRRRPRTARSDTRGPRLRAQRPRSRPAWSRVRNDRPGQHRPPRHDRQPECEFVDRDTVIAAADYLSLHTRARPHDAPDDRPRRTGAP